MFLRDALTSERQRPRARDKACGSFAGLGGHVTGAQDGLWVVEGPVATVRTGVATEPDHTGKPQLLQHLLEPGVQVRQAAQVDGAVHVLVALQGRGVYSTRLSLLSPTVWRSRLSSTAIEMGLPQKLKVVSWEQWLRAGRRALNWESMMPHSSRSRSWRVAEAFSIRTQRGLELMPVRLTPLRLRSFSRLTLGHCDRCIRSASEIRHLVIDKVSRGFFRHLERDRAVSPGRMEVVGGGMWGGPGLKGREAHFTISQSSGGGCMVKGEVPGQPKVERGPSPSLICRVTGSREGILKCSLCSPVKWGMTYPCQVL